MTVSLDAQIAAVKRECALRENVYRKRIASGQMRQAEADHELAAMKAVLATVMAVKRLRATFAEHPPEACVDDTYVCSCGWDAGDMFDEAFEAWLDHVFERSKAAEELTTGNR